MSVCVHSHQILLELKFCLWLGTLNLHPYYLPAQLLVQPVELTWTHIPKRIAIATVSGLHVWLPLICTHCRNQSETSPKFRKVATWQLRLSDYDGVV